MNFGCCHRYHSFITMLAKLLLTFYSHSANIIV
nr:MAG TPA: Phosphoglycerate kinase [Caudoviricetes sp.]